MAKNSLSPHVAGLPSIADIEQGISPRKLSFAQLVRPYIMAELRENEQSVQMATCINGQDSVYGGRDFDKAYFAQRVAKRYEDATENPVKPHDFPTIERVTQNLLRGSGNSRSQRRQAARERRDNQS